MKMKYYAILVGLLVAIFLAWYLYKKTIAKESNAISISTAEKTVEDKRHDDKTESLRHEIQVSNNRDKTVITEGPELWIRPFSIDDTNEEREEKFKKIVVARYAESKLRTPNWQDGDLEDEGYAIDFGVSGGTKMNLDTETLSLDRQRVTGETTPLEEMRHFRNWIYVNYAHSKEGKKIVKIRYEKSEITDEDIEFLNSIVERLNEAGKTNASLRNYWLYTRGEE